MNRAVSNQILADDVAEFCASLLKRQNRLEPARDYWSHSAYYFDPLEPSMFDFRLNSTTRFDQDEPTSAALAGGGFVTVWQDSEIEGSFNDGIYGYITTDTVFKREFRIAEDPDYNEFDPVIEALPGGGFVVGWFTNGPDDQGYDDPYDTPYVRFFDADAEPITGDIQLAPSQQGDVYLRDIAVLADNSVLFLTEETQSVSTFIWDHTARRYSETGTLLDGPKDILTDIRTSAAQGFVTYHPEVRVIPLNDGGYLTTFWANTGEVNGINLLGEVFTRAYNANGSARSNPINISSQASATNYSKFDHPEIADLENGRVLVAWDADFDDWQDTNDDYVSIQYRYLNYDGQPVSQIFSLEPPQEEIFKENDEFEQVVSLGGGYAGIVFKEFSEEDSDFYQDIYDIRMQIIDPLGQKFGPAISLVNTLKEDPDFVEVTVLNSGEILTTYHAEASDHDVYATIFDDLVSEIVPVEAGAPAQDDIFFFNANTGSVGRFEMPFASWSGVGTAGSGWQARGTGLFDSDDTSSDILWFNPTTGAVGRFDLDGSSTSWSGIGRAGTGWEVMGAGDFNGDGVDDILWFNDVTNTSGQFRMSAGSGNWASIGVSGSSWDFSGIGDFNADGIEDILWWNAASKSLGQFRMSASSKTWENIAKLGTGYEVVGTGDFDGDGSDDILVFNSTVRKLGMFEMDGGSANWAFLGTTGTGWRVAGTGDFDNSGTDDILWRHTDGRIGQYQMDGPDFSWNNIGNAGADWDVLL